MANSYVDIDDVREVMPDTDWDGVYLELISTLAERASRVIDRAAGREPGAFYPATTAAARYFDGYGGIELWVDEMAAAPTLVEVDEGGLYTYTSLAATDYTPWPYNATPYRRLDILRTGNHARWPAYTRGIRVTAKWGFSLLPPEDIKQATLTQAVRYFKRAQQAYQDTGAIVELGQLRYVQDLDPDVAMMITHYRRVAI